MKTTSPPRWKLGYETLDRGSRHFFVHEKTVSNNR